MNEVNSAPVGPTGETPKSAISPLAFVTWVHLTCLGFGLAFVLQAAPETGRAWLYAGAVIASYAGLYALPTLLAGLAVRPLLRRGRLARVIAGILLVTVATVTQLLLAADYTIHRMFGYHINGFVINLITTPEGIASMGADDGAALVYALIGVGVIVLNAALWCMSATMRPGRRLSERVAGRPLSYAVIVLVMLGAGERFTYGVGNVQAWPDVMAVAAAIPAYQPTTFRSLARKLGFKGNRSVDLNALRNNDVFIYPLHPIKTVAPEKKYNVVWLVCESLRADMLTPEIMPKTWAFAQENTRFTQHRSGGNGTRMGVFTLFYGMPGNYWFRALANRRSPVLMDRLQEEGYELHLSTSAAFSYPEFDKTVFARVPVEQLYAANEGEGWQSDRHHVARIKTWLEHERGTQPFFLFHFFESSHARYYFPPESVINLPYLEEFNYATVNLKRDIELIHARYINSVHHLDSQLGEVLQALRDKNLMEGTVVLITGDHGEEFLENGNWGHNSEFTEAQVRVPLVVHIPGRPAAVVEHATSHVDLVPTLAPLLGVTNPTRDYSTGTDLFSDATRLLTFADWDRIAISDGRHKAIFPLRTPSQIMTRLTTADDRKVADEGAVLRQQGASMATLMTMINRFARVPKDARDE
jgi:membrane-anchored protein YejM (alkaline phosphatase superfamily)